MQSASTNSQSESTLSSFTFKPSPLSPSFKVERYELQEADEVGLFVMLFNGAYSVEHPKKGPLFESTDIERIHAFLSGYAAGQEARQS